MAALHELAAPGLRELVERRASGDAPLDFLLETQSVRDDAAWQVAEPGELYADRRVELSVAPEHRALSDAVASGAEGIIARLDQLAPSSEAIAAGHASVQATTRDARTTVLIRPRDARATDPAFAVGAGETSAALVDLALHAGGAALRGGHLYVDLPGVGDHLEARWWNDTLAHAERLVGLPYGTIRARVAIETAQAALQMDEILWELRDRSIGLAAAAEAYLSSIIRAFHEVPLPGRSSLTMEAPFVHAYLTRLVRTCHNRGTHAIGPTIPFLDAGAVGEAASRLATSCFDGVTVADPRSVAVAQRELASMLGSLAHQISRLPPVGLPHDRADLLSLSVPGGQVTLADVRSNIEACLTPPSNRSIVELCREQLSQWLHIELELSDGSTLSATRFAELVSVHPSDDGSAKEALILAVCPV